MHLYSPFPAPIKDQLPLLVSLQTFSSSLPIRNGHLFLFTRVLLFTSDLDICQGGGFATPSGVISEALFAKSTKIDGVISRALAADQIQSCLAAVPPFCKRGQLPYNEGRQH